MVTGQFEWSLVVFSDTSYFVSVVVDSFQIKWSIPVVN